MIKRKQIVLLTILIIFFLNFLFASEQNLTLFNEIIKANTGIKSLDAKIIQHIDTAEHSREVFAGRYIADNSGRFKIEYTSPSKQTVLNNGQAIYWYFQDSNLLYILGREKTNHRDPKINSLQEFQNKDLSKQFKIEFLGKELYGFFKLAHKFAVKDIKNDMNFNIKVDAKSNILLSKIITNSAGVEILKEEYSNYELIKNIYFPKRIDVYARTNKGIIRNTTEYDNILLNYSVPENMFEIRFPANARKKYLYGD